MAANVVLYVGHEISFNLLVALLDGDAQAFNNMFLLRNSERFGKQVNICTSKEVSQSADVV